MNDKKYEKLLEEFYALQLENENLREKLAAHDDCGDCAHWYELAEAKEEISTLKAELREARHRIEALGGDTTKWYKSVCLTPSQIETLLVLIDYATSETVSDHFFDEETGRILSYDENGDEIYQSLQSFVNEWLVDTDKLISK